MHAAHIFALNEFAFEENYCRMKKATLATNAPKAV
jgi:hypothetical protein